VIDESCNIWKMRPAQLIVVFALLLVLFGSGCNKISPKLQDEYIRPGLSQGMCRVFEKYRQSLPKKMAEDKVPGRADGCGCRVDCHRRPLARAGFAHGHAGWQGCLL
jgi:hypothetical protein